MLVWLVQPPSARHESVLLEDQLMVIGVLVSIFVALGVNVNSGAGAGTGGVGTDVGLLTVTFTEFVTEPPGPVQRML